MVTRSNSNASINRRLYTSHALSAWNSRTFEFGAILFLASIYPGTLLYASIYALLRSLAAALFSSRVGSYIDETDRLASIRHGIVWQRISVVASCGLFWVMLEFGAAGVWGGLCFGVSIGLACVEKLASLGTTVAVERDWVVVVCEQGVGLDRAAMNAGMRRIDLFCKLVAPVFISFLDAMMGTTWAVGVTMGLSAASVGIEYWAIARVYYAVPALRKERQTSMERVGHDLEDVEHPMTTETSSESGAYSQHLAKSLLNVITPWTTYLTSPAFLPSLSLSLLYLTVLSTGPHWQTYLLATSYPPLTVSVLRVLAVISELAATVVAPYLMDRIGPIRSGLWSINWQVIALAPAVGLFYHLSDAANRVAAGAVLTAGMIVSRLGLWSFDLSVQFLVQEHTPAQTRAAFSSCEVALQNFFALLSFAATVAFPEPSQFAIPVLVSFAAVVSAAVCFAAYVRRERGHLLHAGRCLGYEKRNGYDRVEESELGDLGQREVGRDD